MSLTPSHQRLDAAKSRIESLNPLVKVETITDITVQDEGFEQLVKSVDLVCVADLDRNSLVCLPLRFLSPFVSINYQVSNQWHLQKISETLLRWWDIWTRWLYLL